MSSIMREDWIECTLGEVCEVNMGQSPPSSTYNTDGIGLPFFQGKAEFTDLHPVVKKWCSVPKKIANKNDILLSVRAPVGSTNIADQECSIGRGLAAITYKYGNMFIWYYLKSIEPKLDSQGTGTTFKAISGTILKSQIIEFPPLVEQKAIVKKIEELFSSLDSGIADLKKAQDQLVVYRQAVLKKAFEGELTKEWREGIVKTNSRSSQLPSAEELLEQIEIGRQNFFNKQIEEWELELKKWKEKGEIGKKPKKPRPLTIPDAPNNGHNERKWVIPNNWVWSQIGSLCFVTKLAGFEYTDYVNYDENGDLPVLKAENAGTNGFKKTDFSRVKSESVKMLKRSQIFGGELLIVFVGAGTGNVAMVPFNQRYFLGPNIGMARPYFDLNSKYLELFLQSAFGKSLMMSAVKAVAQPSLSMGTIRQAPIAFPSLEEQHQIVQEIESRLSVCDKVEKDIADSLEKAKALRQSILKKAFEGTLLSEDEIAECKADKDYEPASVLLERIKKEKRKK
ncbi:MAG: restriction endonuclease subunit S [Bizionia sp.]|nr:restriction endonuclease subunit S [Bizionia sp.]